MTLNRTPLSSKRIMLTPRKYLSDSRHCCCVGEYIFDFSLIWCHLCTLNVNTNTHTQNSRHFPKFVSGMQTAQKCSLVNFSVAVIVLLCTAVCGTPLYHLLALPTASFAVCNNGCTQSFGKNCYLACPRSQVQQNQITGLLVGASWNNARLGT